MHSKKDTSKRRCKHKQLNSNGTCKNCGKIIDEWAYQQWLKAQQIKTGLS